MKYLLALLLGTFITTSSIAADGTVDVLSKYSVEETADRFEKVLNKKGMTIFKRIKHSEGAKKVGVDLRDTQVIIFGNPKVGSPLMQCAQSIAIDLPQKALIWKNAKGQVYITYNDPSYLRKRHNVSGCDPVFAKITKALAGLTGAAVK